VHRLTPRAPYQASPEAWLDAFEGIYSTGPGADQIWWRLPSHFATEFTPTTNFTFRGVPSGPALVSLVVEAWPFGSRTGEPVIDIGAHRTEFAISTAVSRTIDIGFVHDGGDPMDVGVLLRAGLIDFVFHSIALGAGLIVLDPIA